MYIYLKIVLWPYVNWPGTKLSLMMEIPAMSDTRRPCWLSACPWVSRWWSSPRTGTLTLGSLLAKSKREGFSSILWRKILVKHERESHSICTCTCIDVFFQIKYVLMMSWMFVLMCTSTKHYSPTLTTNVPFLLGMYDIIYIVVQCNYLIIMLFFDKKPFFLWSVPNC